MKNLTLALAAFGVVATSTPSFADLQVQFLEGAPKDQFIITNVGKCALGAGRFKIDFANSNAGLIFDVTGFGAGVEVFQPFEVTLDAQYLPVPPSIKDGDQRAVLDMSDLGVNESISFTIDLDDTVGTRAITVSDSEISGTTFTFIVSGAPVTRVWCNSRAVTL